MDASKLYVPDVSKWIDFYKHSYLQNKKRYNQLGRSIVGGVKTSIIPIEDKKKIREPERGDQRCTDQDHITIASRGRTSGNGNRTTVFKEKNRTLQSSQQR